MSQFETTKNEILQYNALPIFRANHASKRAIYMHSYYLFYMRLHYKKSVLQLHVIIIYLVMRYVPNITCPLCNDSPIHMN